VADAKSLELLKQALRRLPGVGPKSAQRMAFHLLERDREGARQIAESIGRALAAISCCRRCNTFSEQPLCEICASPRRDATLLCVVETPADLEAVEQAGVYQGMYFVLMGRLSPLDGVGPEQLGLDRLQELLDRENVREVILATNSTEEGEATAEYLHQLLGGRGLTVSRLARGLPVGGEIEYLDQGTIAQAFAHRLAW
jgi:recombination protein RecR